MFKLTQDEYDNLRDNGGGYCLICRTESLCLEPDARNIECDNCEQKQVFGIEELLMMGKVEIV